MFGHGFPQYVRGMWGKEVGGERIGETGNRKEEMGNRGQERGQRTDDR